MTLMELQDWTILLLHLQNTATTRVNYDDQVNILQIGKTEF